MPYVGGNIQFEELVSGSVSCVGSAFIILTFALFPNLRKLRYIELVFYVAVNDLFASIGIALGPSEDGSWECWYQGISTSYNYISSVFWTVIITYQVYRVVVLKGSVLKDMMAIHWICWGLPLIITCMPLTTSTYANPDDEATWCFVADRLSGSPAWSQLFWFIAAFYAWVWIAMMVNTYQLLRIYARIRRMRVVPESLSSTVKKLVFYPLIIIICWSLNTISNVYIFSSNQDYNSASPKWDTIFKMGNILAASQGFLNALVFVVMNPLVRQQWHYVYLDVSYQIQWKCSNFFYCCSVDDLDEDEEQAGELGKEEGVIQNVLQQNDANNNNNNNNPRLTASTLADTATHRQQQYMQKSTVNMSRADEETALGVAAEPSSSSTTTTSVSAAASTQTQLQQQLQHGRGDVQGTTGGGGGFGGGGVGVSRAGIARNNSRTASVASSSRTIASSRRHTMLQQRDSQLKFVVASQADYIGANTNLPPATTGTGQPEHDIDNNNNISGNWGWGLWWRGNSNNNNNNNNDNSTSSGSYNPNRYNDDRNAVASPVTSVDSQYSTFSISPVVNLIGNIGRTASGWWESSSGAPEHDNINNNNNNIVNNNNNGNTGSHHHTNRSSTSSSIRSSIQSSIRSSLYYFSSTGQGPGSGSGSGPTSVSASAGSKGTASTATGGEEADDDGNRMSRSSAIELAHRGSNASSLHANQPYPQQLQQQTQQFPSMSVTNPMLQHTLS